MTSSAICCSSPGASTIARRDHFRTADSDDQTVTLLRDDPALTDAGTVDIGGDDLVLKADPELLKLLLHNLLVNSAQAMEGTAGSKSPPDARTTRMRFESRMKARGSPSRCAPTSLSRSSPRSIAARAWAWRPRGV